MVQGKLINGEVYLSVSTIKNILYQDVIIAEKISMSQKEYILSLIERLNAMTVEYFS